LAVHLPSGSQASLMKPHSAVGPTGLLSRIDDYFFIGYFEMRKILHETMD
jgi:hypothetical protein